MQKLVGKKKDKNCIVKKACIKMQQVGQEQNRKKLQKSKLT